MIIRTVGHALRTLYEEAVEFRFDYPLMVVPEAGPKESLHYYLYKYKERPPNRPVIRRDANGIPQLWNRVTGLVYRPAFIAMYGLGNLNHYLRSGDKNSLEIFLNQVSWLERHAVIREDGAIVWPHNFDLQEGPVLLKSPWVSANVQGYAISALVRGWRITRHARLLEILNATSKVFELDWNRNGIRVHSEGHVVYTEAPGLRPPGIMDGFMRSLLGLYDLYMETGEGRFYNLFEQGLDGLRYFLPRWDYRRKWSLYSNGEYLCPPGYHALNRSLLAVIARLTGDRYFAEYAEAWNPERLTVRDRTEIYIGFLVTKNACRWKYRTWRQRTVGPTYQGSPIMVPAKL